MRVLMLRERVYGVILRACLSPWESVVVGIDWEIVSRLQCTILQNRRSRLVRLGVVVFLMITVWRFVDNVVGLHLTSLRRHHRLQGEEKTAHCVPECSAHVEI